jgi:hypothetical protein
MSDGQGRDVLPQGRQVGDRTPSSASRSDDFENLGDIEEAEHGHQNVVVRQVKETSTGQAPFEAGEHHRCPVVCVAVSFLPEPVCEVCDTAGASTRWSLPPLAASGGVFDSFSVCDTERDEL